MKWADLKELEECEELNKVFLFKKTGNSITSRTLQINQTKKR